MSTAQNQQSGGGNQPYLKTWDKYSDSVADKRKTLLLPINIWMEDGIAFNHKNWRFTKGRGYRVHNDNSDHTRNFIDVGQMNNRKGLMFLNRHYSDPKGLKFDLCVDVKQKSEAGVNMVTPIIIDPSSGNNGHSFP